MYTKISEDERMDLNDTNNLEETTEILLNKYGPSGIIDKLDGLMGWPDGEYFEVRNVTKNGSLIEAKCSVSYDDVQSSGCADLPHRQPCFQEFTFSINSEDGEMDFVLDQEND